MHRDIGHFKHGMQAVKSHNTQSNFQEPKEVLVINVINMPLIKPPKHIISFRTRQFNITIENRGLTERINHRDNH